VYQYIELIPARYLTIDGAEIFFAVPEGWLDENNLRPDDIVLYHATGNAWQPLPTRVLDTRDGQVMFAAQSNGFSIFAIAGIPRADLLQPSPEIPKQSPVSTVRETIPARVPEQPAPVETTVPVPDQPDLPDSASPLLFVLAGTAGCCCLIGTGMVVRQWWMRRQNPSLFRKYR
jgi:hypothetical protein